jgi:hypothetical protein
MRTRVILFPPLDVPLVRALADRDNLAALIDRLPHAIEAGYADRIIGALKPWAAWHELYPMDRALQADRTRWSVDTSGGATDSR